MSKFKFYFLFGITFLFLSACTTVNPGHSQDMDFSEPAPVDPFTVENAIDEIQYGISSIDQLMKSSPRDIDSEDWLTMKVNLFASRDIFVIEKIATALKYTFWSDLQKKELIEYYINPDFGPEDESSPAVLQSMRLEFLEEMTYLVQHSTLFTDVPWMMRSRFNEKSEFSYWYIMYISKNINPLWVDNTILPAMLQLIPVDEITPVTYLWLKNPNSLIGMEQEILLSGYPWTNLTDIIRFNKELIQIIEDLYRDDEVKPGQYREGVLI